MRALTPLIFGIVLLASCGKPALPPVMGALAAFDLVDQDGQPLTRESLAGSTWVVDFFFTRCPSICPRMTERMESVAARWTGDSPKLLSVSIDPEWDTSQRLQAYAEERDLPQARWRFATGDKKAIRALCTGTFRLAMGRGMDEDGDILHSSRFILVDAKGDIRGAFDGLDDSGHQALDAALQALLAEAGS